VRPEAPYARVAHGPPDAYKRGMRAALYWLWARRPPWPVAALAGTAGFYALFGSPTPDVLGPKEAILALGLLLAVGPAGARAAIAPLPDEPRPAPLWLGAGRALLLYGLGAGLLMAVFCANAPVPMVRDVVAFCLLLLPVFFLTHASAAPTAAWPWIAGAACVVGLVFAMRTLGLAPGLAASHLFYLANAPTVLFTALLLGATGARLLFCAGGPWALLLASALLLAALLPAAAIAVNLQRASVGALLAVGFLVAVAQGLARPRRLLVVALVLALAAAALLPLALRVLAELTQKTQEVGLNNRGEELAAVWEAIAAHPATLLFGMGWGGMFQDPAVGGVSVNFTHALLSSALLKLGLVGLALVALYIGALAAVLARMAPRAPGLALALAAPLLIDTFLYAAYKSFDFGLVLTLIPLSAAYVSTNRARAPGGGP
jgi:hypothetical protein